MLSRLVFGLALGLLMYMPRPRGPESGLPPTLPPGADGPPIDDGPPVIDYPSPEDGPPGDVLPIPLPDPGGRRHVPGHTPSVPPTPPPGYEGEWPPAGERPDAPPTPPPGHEGPWPGRRPGVFDLIDQVKRLLFDVRVDPRMLHADAKVGAEAASAAGAGDVREA